MTYGILIVYNCQAIHEQDFHNEETFYCLENSAKYFWTFDKHAFLNQKVERKIVRPVLFAESEDQWIYLLWSLPERLGKFSWRIKQMNFFIKPNCKCDGGNVTFSLFASGSLTIFFRQCSDIVFLAY